MSSTRSSILCVPALLSERYHHHQQQQQQQQQQPTPRSQQQQQQQTGDAINSPLSAAIRETLSVLQQRWDCVSPIATHVDDRSSSTNNLFFQSAVGDCTASFRYADDLSETSTMMMDNYHGVEQMRRLSSWGTFATNNSNDPMSQSQYLPIPYPQFDDNGKPIDPLVFERALEHRRRRSLSNNSRSKSSSGHGPAHGHASRPKTVKFAYPPITSLRQCPRHDDPDLMADLFFTSSELDQYEEDRRQTTMVDDVEIVAVSTSSLSRDEGSANGEEETLYSNSNNKFGRYVPSPTKKGKQRHHTPSRGHGNNTGTGTVPPSLSWSANAANKHQQQQRQPDQQQQHHHYHQQQDQQPQPHTPSKRLIKSVQIFLRERSTGNL
jgi:hypothetical protein